MTCMTQQDQIEAHTIRTSYDSATSFILYYDRMKSKSRINDSIIRLILVVAFDNISWC